MKITLNPHAVPTAERDEKVANCGFGKYYTDHMVVCEWTEADGWQEPELKPYGPISLDPATAVFHYGQEIFEGMKAYRQPDGGISLFRPEANSRRFAKSAKRLALPEMPEELFLETIHTLVKQDAGWTPGKVGEALYIRPFMIATEVGLGVRPTNKATYLLIATPAGAYFDPTKAVSVWISTEYVRAAQGGTGEAKCGGNYAASLVAQKAAAKEGCDQVVWIDAKERKWVDLMQLSLHQSSQERCCRVLLAIQFSLLQKTLDIKPKRLCSLLMIGAKELHPARSLKFLHAELPLSFPQLVKQNLRWAPGLQEMANRVRSQCRFAIIYWQFNMEQPKISMVG